MTCRDARFLGFFLIGLSAVMLLPFLVAFDYAEYASFQGRLATARGTVERVEPTFSFDAGLWGRRSGRGRPNENERIMAVSYSFTGPDGVHRSGISYRRNAHPELGAQVTVEYPPGHPETSRIRGYRSARYDSVPLPVGFPALLGLVFLGIARFGRLRERD